MHCAFDILEVCAGFAISRRVFKKEIQELQGYPKNIQQRKGFPEKRTLTESQEGFKGDLVEGMRVFSMLGHNLLKELQDDCCRMTAYRHYFDRMELTGLIVISVKSY